MRRSAWIFLAAILLPSLVLAWLAVRSARDQQVILEHQQAVICQNITDGLAKSVQDQVDSSRVTFVDTVDQLLQTAHLPQYLANQFNQKLQKRWKLAEVGFAVDVTGTTIYSPQPYEGVLARTFRNENDRFLSNRENVEVFAQTPQKAPAKLLLMPQAQADSVDQASQPSQSPMQQSQSAIPNQAPPPPQLNRPLSQNGSVNASPNQSNNQSLPPQVQSPLNRNAINRNSSASENPSQSLNQAQQTQRLNPGTNQSPLSNNTPQSQAANQAGPQQVMSQSGSQAGQSTVDKSPPKAKQRQVEPQSTFGQNAFSNTVPEESDFRRVIGSQTSGALGRFLEDKLHLMVWYRPQSGPLVFGAQITQQGLIESLQPLIQSVEFKKNDAASSPDYALVILDDRGKPVASSRSGFTADWKHPFAATEIGEALPHWEAALYLLDPKQINRSASTLQLTLGLIVVVLVAAILLGGWLMAADVRRQMRLAQQKTDFVSNVSHELKTPLTSIRMFADMLAEGRVDERDRQSNYLRIISAESARLTRLINNVLDFARMERGAPGGERRPCDLVQVAREAVDTCRPHLETVGVSVSQELQVDSLPVIADRDALAQIVLNLLSNAEKYGRNEVLVRVRREEAAGRAMGCVDVMDRGPGIPTKKREIIFQPFQRLDDSLASGVSGSGLGLTLARRIAQAHDGNVTYSPREGGGSCFTLTLPLTASETENKSAGSGKAS